MPHITIEYSANLDGRVDLDAFVEGVRRAAIATGVFPVGGIRVRTLRAEHYAIADGNPDYAFIDLSLRMGAGRDAEAKARAGREVFAATQGLLEPLFRDGCLLALSFEIREIDPSLSWRRNAIHAHLESGTGHDSN